MDREDFYHSKNSKNGAPKAITIIVLKWNSLVMHPEEAIGMANSVDIDKIAV